MGRSLWVRSAKEWTPWGFCLTWPGNTKVLGKLPLLLRAHFLFICTLEAIICCRGLTSLLEPGKHSAQACLGCRDGRFDHCLTCLSSRHICTAWLIQKYAPAEHRVQTSQHAPVGKKEWGFGTEWKALLALVIAVLRKSTPPVWVLGGETHKSLSSSFQLGREMTHVGRQWLISVYPREVEPVRVYLTGQALKWRSNKPVKWYYHRNMIDQLNSIRDSGQWD